MTKNSVTEKAAQHTPGPWRWETREPDITVWAGRDEYDPADEHVASIYGDGSVENADANARLIAAAPELLAALKEIRAACAAAMRVLDRHRLAGEFIAEAAVPFGFGVRAEAAIAKAEGGAQ